MSWVIVSVCSLRNSFQVQFLSLSTSPVIENVQSVSGVRGVGPAERTGKSLTRYWPGGRRSASSWSRGRPWKAREMKVMTLLLQESEQVGVDGSGLGRGHPVRKALVGFQCAIPQQLSGQRCRIGVRHDL